jgi:hypothetical protein
MTRPVFLKQTTAAGDSLPKTEWINPMAIAMVTKQQRGNAIATKIYWNGDIPPTHLKTTEARAFLKLLKEFDALFIEMERPDLADIELRTNWINPAAIAMVRAISRRDVEIHWTCILKKPSKLTDKGAEVFLQQWEEYHAVTQF